MLQFMGSQRAGHNRVTELNYVLGTILSTGDTIVNDINQGPVLTELITLWWKSQTIRNSHEVHGMFSGVQCNGGCCWLQA